MQWAALLLHSTKLIEFIVLGCNDNKYITEQCFNALQPDVRSIEAFRDRLLQQNGNDQAANVIDLFFRYGY